MNASEHCRTFAASIRQVRMERSPKFQGWMPFWERYDAARKKGVSREIIRGDLSKVDACSPLARRLGSVVTRSAIDDETLMEKQ